ncbi:mCG147606 [Mus musculus]|nr:mCG147606 [Mus musculus]
MLVLPDPYPDSGFQGPNSASEEPTGEETFSLKRLNHSQHSKEVKHTMLFAPVSCRAATSKVINPQSNSKGNHDAKLL